MRDTLGALGHISYLDTYALGHLKTIATLGHLNQLGTWALRHLGHFGAGKLEEHLHTWIILENLITWCTWAIESLEALHLADSLSFWYMLECG